MYTFGEFYIIVIPKILKVWPSYIAGKRSFVAFTIYQKSGPMLFLVAQVYLIFYHYISRIYLNCTFCVRWEGGGGSGYNHLKTLDITNISLTLPDAQSTVHL